MISPNPASPNGTRARILILLTKNGPMTTAEIAEALGLTPKQVRDNSNQARHENLIASGRDDVTGTLAYSITPAGRDWVKALLSLGKPLAQDMTMLPKAASGKSEETSAVAALASDETQNPPAKCGADCSCSGMSVEVEQSRKIITQQGNEIAILRADLDEAKEEALRQENLAMRKHADCEDAMREAFRQQGIVMEMKSDIGILRARLDEALREARIYCTLEVQFEVERDKLREELAARNAADAESEAASSENKEDEQNTYATETDVEGEIALFGADLPKAQEQAVTLAELYGTPIAVYRIRLEKIGEARRVTQFVAA